MDILEKKRLVLDIMNKIDEHQKERSELEEKKIDCDDWHKNKARTNRIGELNCSIEKLMNMIEEVEIA